MKERTGGGKIRRLREGEKVRPKESTVVQNSHELERKYWATPSSIHLFACTAYFFTCFALLALLERSAALCCAHSLTPELVVELMIIWLFVLFLSVLDHSGGESAIRRERKSAIHSA